MRRFRVEGARTYSQQTFLINPTLLYICAYIFGIFRKEIWSKILTKNRNFLPDICTDDILVLSYPHP